MVGAVFQSTAYTKLVVLTFVLMQVTDGLLICENDGLVMSDNLPPEVLPARRQLAQFFQFTHPL